MRAYLPITVQDLQSFASAGSFEAGRVFMVETGSHEDVDVEELEFESSWMAALRSREMGDSTRGFVLAIDLVGEQVAGVLDGEADLLGVITWSQVQSLLLAESDEPELSWYAAQEIPTYLPQWLA